MRATAVDRKLRRWAVIAVACLFIGAVLNLVATWAICAWLPQRLTRAKAPLVWPVEVPDDWPPAPVAAGARTGLGVRVTTATSGAPAPKYAVTVIRTGFPARCFWGTNIHEGGRNRESGVWVPPITYTRKGALNVVTLLPDAPGCVLNSLFYAILCVPVFWGARRLRRARFGPGQCRRCGYDLTGVRGRCPECGA